MYYLKKFIGIEPSQSKITEDILLNSQIPLINKQSLNYYSIDKEISQCKTGTFYLGKYNNEKVIIKKVDIIKDVLILDEFIFWKNMQGNPFFPEMISVDIKYDYAYIIFKDDIKYNLKNLLLAKAEPLSINNKIFIIKQLLSLLNYLYENKITHRGLRPGIIGLNEDYSIKLLDYGELIDLNTILDKDIQDEMDKYIPPEFIKDNIIDEYFDIYGFGKILQDLFIGEQNKDNNNENINPIMLNIIQRCIEEDKDKRIKFEELKHNLELIINEYYDNNQYSDCTLDDFNMDYLEENNEINEHYQFGKKIEDRINNVIEDLRGNLENKIKELKTDIIKRNDSIYSELDSIKKNIINKINKYVQSSKDIINSFYNKLFDSSLYMQSIQFSESSNDIYDAALKTKGMLKDISVLSKLKNSEEYSCLKTSIEKTKNEIDELIKKNSKEEEFDLVYKVYENQYNNFEKYSKLIKEIKDSFNSIRDLLDKSIENNNIRMNKILAIDLNFGTINENSEYFKSMNNNIYAKIKENSSYIYIYNYFRKSISSHKISDNIKFNTKCYSFFDKEENSIYISGGCPNNDIYNIDNSFYKISINFIPNKSKEKNQSYNIFDLGEYNFEIKKLNPLLKERYSHCMMRSLKEKNLFINIGGKNTKSVEVYNIEQDKSILIQDLPSVFPNPICYEINEVIYLFGSSEFDLNCVYYLGENYTWVEIGYKMNSGSLKKGMSMINYNDIFYLFGGYDNLREYSDIYKLSINDDNIIIEFCQDLSLSHNCSFNSNAILAERKNEEGEKHDIIIMMDSNDIIEEIDLNKGKSQHYELDE